MATGSSSSSTQDYRIVLVGKNGAGKNRIVKAFLPNEELEEGSEKCVVYECEHAGRKICFINTPGWDTTSTESISENIKKEIIRSLTLWSPGPHAVILVLPVNPGDPPSTNELKAAIDHMDLLSERVWNHSMVLFLCEEDMDQSKIKDHTAHAETLLRKCKGSCYILSSEDCEIQISEILKQVDEIMQKNPGEMNFIPKLSDESKTEERELRMCKETVRKRRHSMEEFPPFMSEDLKNTHMKNTQKKNQRDFHHTFWLIVSISVVGVIILLMNESVTIFVTVIVFSVVTILTIPIYHFIILPRRYERQEIVPRANLIRS